MNRDRSYNGFRDLIVFQKSYKLALDIFMITKRFPKEERYSLVDQIRRSSRSVPANIAEAWAKRRYIKAFVSKLNDSLGEASETEVWLDMAKDLNYIDREDYLKLLDKCNEVEKMLNSMVRKPEKFCY